ncbi:MAG: hypothetical protein ABR955_13520 [Verrucomicrobiota bacterium]|jgi:hypothetical protein
MKIILLITCFITLLIGTSGCLVADGGGRGGFHGHSDVVVGPPIVVGPPVVLVR